MLVLSRKRDESIIIGDDIIITVVDILGDKVRLGIDAPQNIPVSRKELYDAVQRENSAKGLEKKTDEDPMNSGSGGSGNYPVKLIYSTY